MKISMWVAFALFISFFLGISIFLINFVKTPLFLYVYFIFVILWLVIIGYSLEKKFPEEMNVLFLVIIIIFVALALTFFGINVKGYYDKNTEFMSSNQALSYQLDNISKTNDYYLSYITFINDEIVKTQQARLDLQSQLNALIAAQNAANQIQNQPTGTTQNNTPIIINERDGDKEND